MLRYRTNAAACLLRGTMHRVRAGKNLGQDVGTKPRYLPKHPPRNAGHTLGTSLDQTALAQ